MTCEYAAYLKLLLLCGYRDELQRYVDDALVAEEPLSDIVLELALAGADDKKRLSVLNEYLRQFRDSDIDYDKAVFEYVLAFLKRKYVDEAMPMKDITDLMYRLALCTERHLDEPWYTMHQTVKKTMGELERAAALSNYNRAQRHVRWARGDFFGGKSYFPERKSLPCRFCGRNSKNSSKIW